MRPPTADLEAIVIVRAAGRASALRVGDVVETLRMPPVDPVPGAPEWARGVARIRGQAVPVVSLAALLSGGPPPEERGARALTVRAGARTVALEVDEVVGVHRVPRARLDALPPLLSGAAGVGVRGVAALDEGLAVSLDAARLLPESALEAILEPPGSDTERGSVE